MASQMASCNSGCRIGHDVQYLDFLFLQKPITSWVLASKAELKKKKKKNTAGTISCRSATFAPLHGHFGK